jgi:tetratricopeptide (TPR) repeat protein
MSEQNGGKANSVDDRKRVETTAISGESKDIAEKAAAPGLEDEEQLEATDPSMVEPDDTETSDDVDPVLDDDDSGEKTLAISIEELGILDQTDPSIAEAEKAASSDDEDVDEDDDDTDEKTAAISIEELGILDQTDPSIAEAEKAAASDDANADVDDDDTGEKTTAIGVEDRENLDVDQVATSSTSPAQHLQSSEPQAASDEPETPSSGSTEIQWYFEIGGGQEGPVDEDVIKAMLREGTLKADNRIWRTGLADWTDAATLAELAAVIAEADAARATPDALNETEDDVGKTDPAQVSRDEKTASPTPTTDEAIPTAHPLSTVPDADEPGASTHHDLGTTEQGEDPDSGQAAASVSGADALDESGSADAQNDDEDSGDKPPSAERTVAMSLEEMLANESETEDADSESDTSEPSEKTMAMSLEEMLDDSSAPLEAEDSTTMEEPKEDEEKHGEESNEQRTIVLEVDENEKPADESPATSMEVMAGSDLGQIFPVSGDSLVLGRGLDCDLILSDASVSRRHFRLDMTEHGYRLVDLGSGNGTKVNRKRVPTFDLTDGTMIEVGQTTLKWLQPGAVASDTPADTSEDDDPDRTRVSNLAAIDILPEWEKGASTAKGSSADQKRSVPDEHKGRILALMAGLGGVLVMGFLGLDLIAGFGVVFPTGDDTAQMEEETQGVDGQPSDTKTLVEQGLLAFQKQDWYPARKKFREALQLDSRNEGAKEGLIGVAAEIVAWRAYEDATRALEDEDFSEAIQLLKTISDTSSYFPDAQALLREGRNSLVESQLLQAQKFQENGQLDKAKTAVKEALKVSPRDIDALAMLEEFNSAQSSGKAAPDNNVNAGKGTGAAGSLQKDQKAKPASGTSSRTESRKTGAKKAGAARRKGQSRSSSSKELKEALSQYENGNFDEAISSLKTRVKGRDRKKAQRLARSVAKFADAYTAGMAAARSFKAQKAIEELSRARKLDSAINGAFTGRIKKEISKQHAFLANSAYGRGKYEAAARNARKALALSPGFAGAKKIYDQVQAKGQSMLDEAKKLASSNRDRALTLLSKVVAIFKAGDSRHAEAYKMLNQLSAEEDYD